MKTFFGKSRTRRIMWASVLFAVSFALLMGDIINDYLILADTVGDKNQHFEAGRIITAIVFQITYLCLLVRVFLSGGGSVTRKLIVLPSLVILVFGASLVVTVIAAGAKEIFDVMTTTGTGDMGDIGATLEGAMRVFPKMVILLVITPFLIPIDTLAQIPVVVKSDVKTGFDAIDEYVRLRKRNSGKRKDVLLLEDDYEMASVFMKLLEKRGLGCHHVSGISEARKYLTENVDEIILVIADNFVKKEEEEQISTGSMFLREISETFPRGKYFYKTVLSTGYPEHIEGFEVFADMILVKPVDFDQFNSFVDGIVGGRGGK